MFSAHRKSVNLINFKIYYIIELFKICLNMIFILALNDLELVDILVGEIVVSN